MRQPTACRRTERSSRRHEAFTQQGALVNQAVHNGVTPLHVAAQNGHREVVELLLKQGAAINQKARTSLHRSSSPYRITIETLRAVTRPACAGQPASARWCHTAPHCGGGRPSRHSGTPPEKRSRRERTDGGRQNPVTRGSLSGQSGNRETLAQVEEGRNGQKHYPVNSDRPRSTTKPPRASISPEALTLRQPMRAA